MVCGQLYLEDKSITDEIGTQSNDMYEVLSGAEKVGTERTKKILGNQCQDRVLNGYVRSSARQDLSLRLFHGIYMELGFYNFLFSKMDIPSSTEYNNSCLSSNNLIPYFQHCLFLFFLGLQMRRYDIILVIIKKTAEREFFAYLCQLSM